MVYFLFLNYTVYIANKNNLHYHLKFLFLTNNFFFFLAVILVFRRYLSALCLSLSFQKEAALHIRTAFRYGIPYLETCYQESSELWKGHPSTIEKILI
ncbi:hypothetical protein XENTR_v10014540 [Xenopus tropicalis]|nr:hypothetical protein XENTR_v10014540 [Xenopus tropicalis]